MFLLSLDTFPFLYFSIRNTMFSLSSFLEILGFHFFNNPFEAKLGDEITFQHEKSKI